MAFTPLQKVAVAVLFFFWLLYPLQWRYPSVLDKWPSTAVLLSDDVELMQKIFHELAFPKTRLWESQFWYLNQLIERKYAQSMVLFDTF